MKSAKNIKVSKENRTEVLFSKAHEISNEILVKYVFNELENKDLIEFLTDLVSKNSAFNDRIKHLKYTIAELEIKDSSDFNLRMDPIINRVYEKFKRTLLRKSTDTKSTDTKTINKSIDDGNNVNHIVESQNVESTGDRIEQQYAEKQSVPNKKELPISIHQYSKEEKPQTRDFSFKNVNRPIIIGLDIGTTKIVAIAARKNEYGKLEILGVGRAESAGVTHGVIMNIEQCIRSIEQAVDNCIQSNPKLAVKEVYVGIAGQHIKSLQTHGDRVRVTTDSEINQKDIDQLVADQRKTYIPAGDEIIDIIPQDFTVDDTANVTDPIGMSGAKIGANFHIVTGDRNAIRNIKRCVDRAQLITRDIVLQPLASAAAVITDEDLEAGVAVVDIGGGTTDMAVFYDGILKHTAVIPYAGVNITNDIRNGVGVLRAQAEQMKVQFGMALADEANANAYITIPGLRGLPPKEISMKNLSHIIQARMQEILDYVLYHLKQLGLENRLYGGIILTGGGAQLKHIVQLTEYITGMGARIGYPNEHLTGDLAEELMNPMYSTCIGLILRGLIDHENGRMAFIDDGGNFLSMTSENMGEVVTKKAGTFDTNEINNQQNVEKQKKRVLTLGRLFDGFKGTFMKTFESVEDEETS